MLVTTIYNQDNACITGVYYDAKGNSISVEFMGTALECECYIEQVKQDNEGSNEVQHVVNRATLGYNDNDVNTSKIHFALHSVWGNVVAA